MMFNLHKDIKCTTSRLAIEADNELRFRRKLSLSVASFDVKKHYSHQSY